MWRPSTECWPEGGGRVGEDLDVVGVVGLNGWAKTT
jgi:hypothetical protein